MKNLLLIIFLVPVMSFAQLHVSVGAIDVTDREDGYTIVSQLGYTHYLNKIGIGVNYRNVSMRGDLFETFELNTKYRFFNKPKYRFDAGFSAGFNSDDKDIYPIATIRNSIKLYDNLWLDVFFDNAYRNSNDYFKSGWRLETYLMFGFSMDFIDN